MITHEAWCHQGQCTEPNHCTCDATPTAGLTLTDDQVLALAKALNALPATVFSPHVANDAEFVALLAARATISNRADVVIHESRSSRR